MHGKNNQRRTAPVGTPHSRKRGTTRDAAKLCPYGKRTLERWVFAYKQGGEDALEPKSTEPKRHHSETPIALKERVIALRKKTGLCALKLHWQLEKEDVHTQTRTTGKLLKEEGLVRKYRVKRVKYKYLKAERKPGELIEIDVKYAPGMIAGAQYYQHTAIDVATRWRHMAICEEQPTHNSICFLREVVEKFPYPIIAVKTDNHSAFASCYLGANKRPDATAKTLHAFGLFCATHGITHYLIDKGKPAQNGKVERSHREDQEKFYDKYIFRSMRVLQKKLRKRNMCYNDLEHCRLRGKTPNEFLREYQSTNPPNVCT